MLKKIFNTFIHRLGLDLAADKILFRKVAKTAWYQGDGAALMMLLTVQILTGAVLTLSYSNSISHAYESVLFITNNKTMGWFIRALHYWSAGLFVLMLLFHVLRNLLVGGYKAPREGIWWIGVLLFFLVIIMSFSGYVLRWDERGVYAIKVLVNLLSNIPVIGDSLILFVQGGSEVNTHTLTRFYSVHVILVPGLIVLLAGFHLYLVIRHGTTSKMEQEIPVKTYLEHKELYNAAKKSPKEGEDFFPMTMASSGTMSFIVFILAVILALAFGPRELSQEANLTTLSYPQEEWWFYWYSALIAVLPPKTVPYFVVWFPVTLFMAMMALPLIDRGPNRGLKHRPFFFLSVTFLIITLAGLTALRIRSPWTGKPSAQLPPFPKQFITTPELFAGRKLFVKYGCNSCHAVAGHGPEVGPDITKMKKLLTSEEIRNVILHPPPNYAMPSYRGRLSEDELKFITEFVFVLQIQPRQR